jgi:hypothetical protein
MGSLMKSTKIRWVYAAGAAVACAGILVASSLVANAGTHPSAQSGLQAGAQPGAQQSAEPSARPATTPAEPTPKTLGDVIKTGSGNWVLYAQAIKDKAIPKTHFGIMLGRQSADGKLTGDVMANEAGGSDRSAGFHAVEGSMNVNGHQTLTFGYYVGAAKKITGQAHGKTVTAGLATWSEDSSVHVFWFGPSVQGVGHLAAFDKSGHKLAAGHSEIGVG